MSKHRQDRNQPALSQNNGAITAVTQTVAFSGPLPHPALLAKYNEVIPNGAERIMSMAERQSVHRESLEAQVIAGNIKSQARGSLYAFIICLISILGGFGLIFMGRNVDGLVAILSSLVALAGVFVYAKRQQGKERTEKAAALASRRRN